MPSSEKGFSSLFVILFLMVAIGIGGYLVQNQTNLFPKAATKSKFAVVQYPSAQILIDLNQEDDEYLKKLNTIYVVLKDKDGANVTNNKNYSYSWAIADPTLSYIYPFAMCTFDLEKISISEIKTKKGQKSSCLENYLYIEPISEGKTQITVNVLDEKKKTVVASGNFDITIVKKAAPTDSPPPYSSPEPTPSGFLPSSPKPSDIPGGM